MKYFLLLPTIVLYALFTAWPIVEVVRLSLYKTNFLKTTFVGLDNYIAALSDPSFVQSIANSLIYALILVPGQLLVALFFTLELYNMSKKWQDISRIIFYLPVLSAGIIISGVWKWIFHMDGPINWILNQFGIESIGWFAQGTTSIPIISFIVVFASFGGNVIILLAAALSIDKGIIEAAKIDGASEAQIKWKIIVPLMKPIITILGFVSAISAFQIFENIYALSPQVYSATMTFFIFQEGFMYSKYGLASAEAVILLIIILSLSLIKRRMEKE